MSDDAEKLLRERIVELESKLKEEESRPRCTCDDLLFQISIGGETYDSPCKQHGLLLVSRIVNSFSDILDRMRAVGWSVAIHNDYKIEGKSHTFWLFTHPTGCWLKGEGENDTEALKQISDAMNEEMYDLDHDGKNDLS